MSTRIQFTDMRLTLFIAAICLAFTCIAADSPDTIDEQPAAESTPQLQTAPDATADQPVQEDQQQNESVESEQPQPQVDSPEPQVAATDSQAQPAPPPIQSLDGRLAMEFSEMPLDTVLDYLSQTTGLIVIKEVAVQGRVSVVSRQPMTLDESLDLLNTLLYQRGYASLRNGRTLTIVTLDQAKKRNIPVRSGADPDAISPTDEMITQVIPIRYADATKLMEDLMPLLPSHAQLSANESSNALILTDTAISVRRIVQIVRELDRHMAAIADVRVFTLQYADAQSTARLINEVFDVESREQQQGGARGARNFFMRAMRGRGGGDEQEMPTGGPSQKVTAAADERTNTVVVSGPPDVLTVIEGVVAQLDSDPAEQQSVFIYSLENADAESLAETLNDLFDESQQNGSRGNNRNNRNNRNRSNNNNNNNNNASPTGNADLAGQVTVVANTDTNSLVVMTASSNFERVRQIIADLDRPVPQVLIKVLIAEVTHDDDIDIGVEFSAMNLAADDTGWMTGTDFGLSPLDEGFKFSIIETNIDVAVHALQEIGNLDILSRPYVLASDNQTATITVGQEFPFIRDVRITETGQTLNTIQYQDIGIILEVTPHINPNGLVIMTVTPSITVESEETVEITNDVNAAKFIKRSANTRIAIADGQTIVIGGLVQDSINEIVSQVPLLGDVPLLGELFKRTERKKSKTELLIFLTPHVAQEQNQLRQITESEKQNNTMVQDAVEPGRYEEHLQRMESGKQPQPPANQEQ